MKAKVWLLLFGWCYGMSVAMAGSVSGRALSLAEKLKEEAFHAYVIAQERVQGSQESLELMRSVERDVAGSGDRTAIQTARQAVSEGEQGVREARLLLERAKALLAKRERQLVDVRILSAKERPKPGGLRGAMLAVDGDVRVVDTLGRAVSNPYRPLQAGDRVVTGKDGRARLVLAGGDADALLEPGSDFRITEDSLDAGFDAVLDKGYAVVRARVARWANRFVVRTPICAIGVRGTEFSVRALPNGVRVGVREGVVAVTPNEPGATPAELRSGELREWTRAGGWGPPQPAGGAQPRVEWGD